METAILEAPGLAALTGRILDVDSHEMIASSNWSEIFGPAAGEAGVKADPFLQRTGANNVADPDFPGDVMDITSATVWNTKGCTAPGAADFRRRIAVLDQMGVAKQLVFPTAGLVFGQMADGGSPINRLWIERGDSPEHLKQLGRTALAEYNEWAIGAAGFDPDRVRPVPYLWHGGTVDELVAETTDLVRRGARAVHLSCGSPPAGRSPADPVLDPLWQLLQDGNIPLTFHVGHGSKFLDATWGAEVPAFRPGKVESTELGSSPYAFFSMHHAPMNYLSVMVLGGVFERFPRLRVGVIELGASWFGQFAEHLDMWATKVYRARFAPFLSMLPSEYLARNVRVTPFNPYEPIEDHLRRYPALVDCYCFSSDYPHVEGGVDCLSDMYRRIAPLGQEIVEKFFVTNAEWILP